jgi:hypothetical protein
VPPPPPSPAGPWARSGAPAAPPGTRSGGLRTATIALFWCTAVATVLLVLALLRRRDLWRDVERGDLRVAGRLDDADDLVGSSFGLLFLLAVATLIVLSIWSLRVGRRARMAGATDVSPGLLCGSWYIPYAAAIVPYVQLRRIARHGGRPTGSTNLWQAFHIATWIVATGVLGLEPTEDDLFEDIAGKLSTQVVAASLLLIAAFVMAFVATQALRALDDT